MSEFVLLYGTRYTTWRRALRLTVISNVIVALAISATAHGQIVDTYAGTGSAGYTGDGGPATNATLNAPHGVAVAANGDVYIADKDNRVVRKVDFLTGVISTVAGGGILQLGDGGLATNACTDKPSAVAVDSVGNVYIADVNHHRIRKITASTGILTTIAGTGDKGFAGDGGAAVDAWLERPQGVTVDSAGNVFFSDTGNHRIRKISTGGVISTTAGTGSKGFSGDGGLATSARLNSPRGLRTDAAGNLYFADTANHRIRKIEAGSGIISTIAGTGQQGFSGDGGSATNAKLKSPHGLWLDAAGNIYIADCFNRRVRKVDASTGIITTIAGTGFNGYAGDGGPATEAKLSSPDDVAVNTAGDVFIADTGNNRIRRIDASTGAISTYGGTGVKGFSGDGGPATSAELNEPRGLFIDASGDLFLSDTDNHVIRKIAAATGIITVVAGVAGNNGYGDGGPAAAAALGLVEDVEIDTAGNLYVTCIELGRVRKVEAVTGIITTVMGSGIEPEPEDPGDDVALFAPAGVALDGDGNLYVADKLDHRVRKLTVGTSTYATIAGTGVADYSGDGGPATAAALNAPSDVALDTDGNVYISDSLNHRIRKIDAFTGISTTVAGTGQHGYKGDDGPATLAEFREPQGLMVDTSGNIYTAQPVNHVIRRVSETDGIVTTIAGRGAAGSTGDGGEATLAKFRSPHSIGFKKTGSGPLYIADTENNKVRVVNMAINGVKIIHWREVPRTPFDGSESEGTDIPGRG